MSIGWVRWFPSDWRGSPNVADLSLTERGLYRELLDLQAVLGPFEYDHTRLARQLRCDTSELEACWPRVRHFFEQDAGGLWFNRKMADEVSRGQSLSDAQRSKAKARWCAAVDAAAYDQAYASPTPTPKKTQNQKKKGASRQARSRAPSQQEEAVLVPDGLPTPPWANWVAHLWRRKRPTPQVLVGHRKKLEALVAARGKAAAVQFIEQSIDNNAQGIVPWAYEKAMAGEVPKQTAPAKPVDIDAYYARLNDVEDPAIAERRRKAVGTKDTKDQ